MTPNTSEVSPSGIDYSVPQEAQRLFQTGILENPLLQPYLTAETIAAAQHISFEGNNAPSIPINWRFAESISSLKAYEATVLNVLLQKKYGVGPVDIKINTDHAILFIMSCFLWTLDPEGEKIPPFSASLTKSFKDWDFHNNTSDFYRSIASNIYKTKDGKFFHTHGSLNPDPTLEFLGLPKVIPCQSREEAIPHYQEAVSKYTAEELQELADKSKQAGTICWTADEFRKSEHGKANANTNLFEILPHANPKQKPSWWPSTAQTSPERPLAGLKVVDLTRIIAGPAISRSLAELGASIMRVTAPHLPDLSVVHPDLNAGKWNAFLDLREEDDRQKLRDLILEADVVVQGYRPGVLDKYGFGEKDILELCSNRERGIIYCTENCYGWKGPWMHRSGWQQISDANVGVSYEFGRAMGNDEPVTPVFPNSDFCSGVAGSTGILTALLQRGEVGGSFTVQTALNYYSQWLVDQCGVYPDPVWQDLWKRNGSPVFRHYHAMQHSTAILLGLLHKNSADVLLKPEFFAQNYVRHLGKNMRIVAPVLQFPNGEVKPGYDIGPRTNGVDQPRWPTDLGVEIVE